MTTTLKSTGFVKSYFETLDTTITDYMVIKICLAGDAFVGKSSIADIFAGYNFQHGKRSTIGIDFLEKDCLLCDGTKVRVQIWDTAGQDRFRSACSSFFKKADAAIIAFALDQPESFNNVSTWLKEVGAYADENVNILVMGNKQDIRNTTFAETCIPTTRVDKLQQQLKELGYPISVVECSAKTKFNIVPCFEHLIEKIVKRKREQQKQQDVVSGIMQDEGIRPANNLFVGQRQFTATNNKSCNGSTSSPQEDF